MTECRICLEAINESTKFCSNKCEEIFIDLVDDAISNKIHATDDISRDLSEDDYNKATEIAMDEECYRFELFLNWAFDSEEERADVRRAANERVAAHARAQALLAVEQFRRDGLI